jgi:hypothetical protein
MIPATWRAFLGRRSRWRRRARPAVHRAAFAIAALGAAVALALALAPARARACTPLPDGATFAYPVNFGQGFIAPVPANGALVIMVSCPNCTPCQAAEKAIAISVSDDAGLGIPVRVTEQVFLDHQPTGHLVLVRPKGRFAAGKVHNVFVRAPGESVPSVHSFTAGDPVGLLESDLAGAAAGALATERRERGTIYNCSFLDLGSNSCAPPTWIGNTFGSEHELLPQLVVSVEAPAAAAEQQLLTRVRDRTSPGGAFWRDWGPGLRFESFAYAERHASYCAEVEVRSLLDPPVRLTREICVSHGDLDAPSLRVTDLQAELGNCPIPPLELQPEWCVMRGPPDPSCVPPSTTVTGLAGPPPCAVNQYCGDNPKAGPAGRAALPDPPEPAPPAACLNPRNPYTSNSSGCAIAGAGSAPAGVGLVLVLVALVAARAVRPRRRRV